MSKILSSAMADNSRYDNEIWGLGAEEMVLHRIDFVSSLSDNYNHFHHIHRLNKALGVGAGLSFYNKIMWF